MNKTIIAVAAVVVLIVALSMGFFSCGKGSGIGNGSGNSSDTTESHTTLKETKEKTTTTEESTNIIVKVDEDTIFLDDEECKDVDVLKDKISKIEAGDNKKEYIFEHEYAIKEVADEVSSALHDLEETLGIKVDYN